MLADGLKNLLDGGDAFHLNVFFDSVSWFQSSPLRLGNVPIVSRLVVRDVPCLSWIFA